MNQERSTSLIATTRTETDHSTSSMVIAIGATIIMAKKVPSINAIICVAIHSGSHSSQRPTSLIARAIRMKACHKDGSAWKPL